MTINTANPVVALNTNIDSTSFGRITDASGNRMITFYPRFDF